MINIIEKFLLRKQLNDTIKNNDVKRLYNMDHTKYMITHVAYRIEGATAAVFASQYWDHAQGTLYSSNITFKDGRSISMNETLARKIFWRLQNKYTRQAQR